ncbi:MAG TPA: hypothetical protein PKE03_11640 [Bacteroidales bacterium]|nr:hypothetical protein [Bacteroidales bacterium]
MPFIDATHPYWTNFLNHTPHDLYHLPDYCAIEAWMLGGKALAWCFETKGLQVLMPLIHRSVSHDSHYYDLVSPYGYPGLLSSPQLGSADAVAVIQAFNREAGAEGYISTFVRLNPLLNPWKLPPEVPCRQLQHGLTVSIDLSRPLEKIRAGYSVNHRRNLRGSIDRYVVHIDDYADFDRFILAYNQTMHRKKAHPYYFFPEQYFHAIRHILGHRLIFIAINDNQGTFLSGGLFTLFGKVMQFHLGATMDQALTGSPSKLMIDAAVQTGINRGAALLHLGGGVGASSSDGLFRFKKGFSSTHYSFSSLQFIHNPDVYTLLASKSTPSPTLPFDFFPVYRR